MTLISNPKQRRLWRTVPATGPVLALAAALSLPALAQSTEAPQTDPDTVSGAAADSIVISSNDTDLDAWLWTRRPVVVFADSPADPRFMEQMALLEARMSALADRDVVVITDTDPAARTAVRRKLRPRGFMLVVMAKDGTIVTRKPGPWSEREISRAIDKLPLRQQELRSGG